MDSKKKPKIGRGLTTKPRAGWKRLTKYSSFSGSDSDDSSAGRRASSGDDASHNDSDVIAPSAVASNAEKRADAKGPPGSQRLHLRRCHLCDTVSEQHGVVTKCDGCGKSMAPFYFFNDAQVIIFTDHDTRPESPELTRLSQERLPIRGLTAFW